MVELNVLPWRRHRNSVWVHMLKETCTVQNMEAAITDLLLRMLVACSSLASLLSDTQFFHICCFMH